MATVTAKKNLIEKLEAQSFKSAEDHRILYTHYSKIANRLRSESVEAEYTGDEWNAFGDDKVSDPEKYEQYLQTLAVAAAHKRQSDRKASEVRAERRSYGVAF